MTLQAREKSEAVFPWSGDSVPKSRRVSAGHWTSVFLLRRCLIWCRDSTLACRARALELRFLESVGWKTSIPVKSWIAVLEFVLANLGRAERSAIADLNIHPVDLSNANPHL